MKIIRINSLSDVREGHILKELLPGEYIYQGGMGFDPPGTRAHTNDGPGGRDYHVHEDGEAFLILAGKARMELRGVMHGLVTGDVCVVEPGEDHHLIVDEADPAVYIYFHAGPERNGKQK